MPDLDRCKLQILPLHKENPNLLANNFRELVTKARGPEYKQECLSHFGSVQSVKDFLLDPGNITLLEEWMNSDAHGIAGGTGDNMTWTIVAISDTPSNIDTWIGWMKGNLGEMFTTWLWIVFWFILMIGLWKALRYLVEFLYDVWNTRRVVYLKVILPRSDSKADRERQKELAKDMKEKLSRMAQVYSSLHKLWHLSFMDNITRILFDKPKLTFLLHYEEGKLSFIIATYPEYRKIVESAISAQYAEASLEMVKIPNLFSKKHVSIIPMEPVKEWSYPIRVFKQVADDPLNNIIDAIAKVDPEDTFTISMTIKPASDTFNKRAQKLADALYRKDASVKEGIPLWKKLLPWNLFSFIISGPSEKLIQRFSNDKQRGDPMIRMVKAEEEALNIMAEEAGKPAYEWGILLMSSSDKKSRIEDNVYNVVSAFSIYKDEYNNELDQPEGLADVFGFFLDPLWIFAAKFHLVNFFFKKNIFTVSELTSLFHLPDGIYNRAPIIKWMDYKVLSAPDHLPALKEENTDFLITGIIAEQYKGWDISQIFDGDDISVIGEKTETKTKKQEIKSKQAAMKARQIIKKYGPKKAEIIEEGDKEYLVTRQVHKKVALKTYKDGILLGLNVYRNKYSPIYMKKKDRTRHHYIIGKSGTGKSVYIGMMARQDIWAGNGVCVIDPHGDLVEDVLQYIPKHRAKDVVYFNAGDQERPMWLNLYEVGNSSEADRAVNDATEIFVKMFGPEIFWPRIQEYFKYGSLTLLDDKEDPATLIDVPRLFTDEAYREYKTGRVKNPVVKNFWDKTYNAMGDREKQEIIPYFTSKFVSFVTNSLIRNIIGQTESAFDFREVMDNQKILLINLSKGMIGQMNAQLLGMIMVSKIYNAAMGRADMAEKDRKDFYLYVDEFQNFVTDTFADILSEARKYKLCLIMAHQYIAQLDSNSGNNIGEWKSKVKDAVFGNVWTMQSFKVGAPDAEFLEKEYAPVLVAQDILWIANYKAYMKLNINNSTSRVFSINSIWTQDYKSEKVRDILKQYSAKKYGRKKEFVDAEISARLGILGEEPEEEGVEEQENTSGEEGKKENTENSAKD